MDNETAIYDLILPRDRAITEKTRPDLFDGIVTLTAAAQTIADDDWSPDLYRTTPPTPSPTTLTAIPYYLWANREPGSMLVWIREG